MIIIITITVGMLVWKYEKNQQSMETSQKIVSINKSEPAKESASNEQEKVRQNNKTAQKEDCSDHKGEKMMCLDGTTVNTYNEDCSPFFCSILLDGEKGVTSTPFITKDQKIYYKERYPENLILIDGADINTFEIIGLCASMEMSRSYYSKDKKYVYINSEKSNSIDAKSFEYFGSFANGDGMPYSISISRDKNHVYFACGVAMDFVDKDSFKILGSGYSKDDKKAYYLDHILNKANSESFRVIKYQKTKELYGNFALDKNYVFFEGVILRDVDPKACKSKGLQNCLPSNWHDLIDYSLGGEKMKDGVY